MAARAGRWLLSIAGDDGDGPELIACYGQVWTTILVEIADGTGKRPRSGYKGSGASRGKGTVSLAHKYVNVGRATVRHHQIRDAIHVHVSGDQHVGTRSHRDGSTQDRQDSGPVSFQDRDIPCGTICRRSVSYTHLDVYKRQK